MLFCIVTLCLLGGGGGGGILLSADIFANSLDPDQIQQNVWPDLDPNCLTPGWY